MKEWFLSSELIDIKGLPNSSTGVSQRARRSNWKTRKADNGIGNALEYHISNFNDDVVEQLKEKYGSENTNLDTRNIKQLTKIGVTPILVYDIYTAGQFGAADPDYQIRNTYIPTETLQRLKIDINQARIILHAGDSMEPTLSDEDEVLVDISELTHPLKNGVYVIRIGENVFIKRLKYNIQAGGYDVISDNKDEYGAFTLAEPQMSKLTVLGKVMATVVRAVV